MAGQLMHFPTDLPSSVFVNLNVSYTDLARNVMRPSGGRHLFDTFMHSTVQSSEARSKLLELYQPVASLFYSNYQEGESSCGLGLGLGLGARIWARVGVRVRVMVKLRASLFYSVGRAVQEAGPAAPSAGALRRDRGVALDFGSARPAAGEGGRGGQRDTLRPRIPRTARPAAVARRRSTTVLRRQGLLESRLSAVLCECGRAHRLPLCDELQGRRKVQHCGSPPRRVWIRGERFPQCDRAARTAA